MWSFKLLVTIRREYILVAVFRNREGGGAPKFFLFLPAESWSISQVLIFPHGSKLASRIPKKGEMRDGDI